MAWSEQRPDKSRMYVNKLCILVGPCPAVPTWPEKYSHMSTKLCTNCLKLSGHTGRHGRSRQDVVYLYKMCAQNAWTCPAIPAVAAGQNNLSRQAVPQAHQCFCSSHVVPLASRDTYATNVLGTPITARAGEGPGPAAQ